MTENQVSELEIERDNDDRRLEYEIDFRIGHTEYSYTIDAYTGAVLEHEKDWDD